MTSQDSSGSSAEAVVVASVERAGEIVWLQVGRTRPKLTNAARTAQCIPGTVRFRRRTSRIHEEGTDGSLESLQWEWRGTGRCMVFSGAGCDRFGCHEWRDCTGKAEQRGGQTGAGPSRLCPLCDLTAGRSLRGFAQTPAFPQRQSFCRRNTRPRVTVSAKNLQQKSRFAPEMHATVACTLPEASEVRSAARKLLHNSVTEVLLLVPSLCRADAGCGNEASDSGWLQPGGRNSENCRRLYGI